MFSIDGSFHKNDLCQRSHITHKWFMPGYFATRSCNPIPTQTPRITTLGSFLEGLRVVHSRHDVLSPVTFSRYSGLPRSGKSRRNSGLSQSQGKVREFCCKWGNFVICYQSQGKVREFRIWPLSMHIWWMIFELGQNLKFSMSSFKYHSPKDVFS